MKKKVLRKYARLIAQKGANIQPEQDVLVFAELDQPEFVQMVVEECYKCKANKVTVEWRHQPITKVHNYYQNVNVLGTLGPVEKAHWEYMADSLPARIILVSEDPDGLRGINQQKKGEAERMLYPMIKDYREKIENRHQWCIAAVPGKKWAKKVFPELRVSAAIEALWKAILDTCRISYSEMEDDPVENWNVHNKNLQEHCDLLNSLHVEKLHYYAPNGTDLTIGLMPESVFCGGSEKTLAGITFNPNMPTEECFTSPKRETAEGIVYATKPLSYRGALIESFWIRFHKGKAVEWHAEKNDTLLGQLIGMDEGSAYLGECALVSESSPISRGGILFYNTLFDENAACHLALGKGFADCIKNYQDRTLEECRELGLNNSMVHEDFMIGYAGLNIDAICENGIIVPVFRNGEWA